MKQPNTPTPLIPPAISAGRRVADIFPSVVERSIQASGKPSPLGHLLGQEPEVLLCSRPEIQVANNLGQYGN